MRSFVSMIKSLPVQLVVSILAAFFIGNLLESSQVAYFYTASTCFIDLLLFVLPFMVFCLIFLAISSSQQKSLQLILLVFAGVFLSNFTALFTAYYFSSLTLPMIGIAPLGDLFSPSGQSIAPLLKLPLPTLIGTDKAMILALITGYLASRLPEASKLKTAVERGVFGCSAIINYLLNKIFIPILPLYVFGFCLKLGHEQALSHLFSAYGKVFLLSMLLVTAYILTLYFIGSAANVGLMGRNLKAMTPAALTAFSTMSSAATMPLTLQCTEKTTQDPPLTRLVIPTTSNIHMLGDDLTIVMTAMTLLSMLGMAFPDPAGFALFACAFSIAKLSCVGVPGASVLVILPVLQNYLGFSPEMITLLTTIYILQDSFGTTANVLGNGAFALIIQRILKPSRKAQNGIY